MFVVGDMKPRDNNDMISNFGTKLYMLSYNFYFYTNNDFEYSMIIFKR